MGVGREGGEGGREGKIEREREREALRRIRDGYREFHSLSNCIVTKRPYST